jgi:hypothetical protein
VVSGRVIMTRREKIIVFIMILVIIYGAYNLLLSSHPKKSAQVTVSASVKKSVNVSKKNKLLKDISDVLKEDKITGAQAYIAARAEREWMYDPFSISRLSSEGSRIALGNTKEDVKFIYNGYLEIGNKKIAIINGVDYQTGDNLELCGYKVKSISPSRVIIVNTRKTGKITVPFLEK